MPMHWRPVGNAAAQVEAERQKQSSTKSPGSESHECIAPMVFLQPVIQYYAKVGGAYNALLFSDSAPSGVLKKCHRHGGRKLDDPDKAVVGGSIPSLCQSSLHNKSRSLLCDLRIA
jgi:hypothetical protein